MSTDLSSPHPTRLTRLEQLTLNTWRWAAVKLHDAVDRHAVLEQAAVHAVLASLRDLDDPLALFGRHAQAQPEFQLILSLLPHDHPPSLAHDILDTAFLMCWRELVGDGRAPQELPPLRPRRPEPSR